jgi:two-component system NarL family sensor kinase
MEEKLLARDENIREDAQKTKFLLDKAIQEVRRISRNLRPSELDDLGLAPAIRSLCGAFSQRTGVAIDLSFFELPKNVQAEIELNLYRIIQEALGNIEKHSQATEVTLRLSREDFGIKATIRDNGRGFDPRLARAKTAKTLGMGLVDMKERVALIGGACTLKSAPGEGMELVVQIPLSSQGKSGRKTGEKRKTEKDKITSRG